jgi:SAM-dependent methyltransferase
VLSAAYKKVYAIDISKHYIDLAKEKNKHLSNVEYIHADLSHENETLPACDTIVCINTLLTPNSKNRNSSYNTVINLVRKGGHLILVVPSLESALYSEHIVNFWDSKDKEAGLKTARRPKQPGDPFQGIVELDGTPTKHYLKEELYFMLQNSGFEVLQAEKVQYTWQTEFNDPPRWLKSPYPWDWLVVAKKN